MGDSSHNRREMQETQCSKENSVAKREIYKLKSPQDFFLIALNFSMINNNKAFF